MMVRIELICIGTELLTGKINTHTAGIGEKLGAAGFTLAREHAVGDDPKLMLETFSEAFRRSDVVISAGGLGPTFDDITREIWSKTTGLRLEHHDWLVDDIRSKFEARGIKMPPHNARQALILKGADVIRNAHGTAPGQMVRIRGKLIVLLPGPGRELFPMFDTAFLPRLKSLYPERHRRQKSFLIFGEPESRIDHIVRPWVRRRGKILGMPVTHGILASQGIVSVKFAVDGSNPEKVEIASEKLGAELRKILGGISFGEGTDTLETAVGRLLLSKDKTVAVAESCTGGAIADLLTAPSGASNYFLEGAVTYSNTSKVRRLGVSQKTLDRHGAVSAPTAREMAAGLRKRTGADYALSVTGIAGPTGGTPDKPVGLVYIGLASARGVHAHEFHFRGERPVIRRRAAMTAINLLRLSILASQPPR